MKNFIESNVKSYYSLYKPTSTPSASPLPSLPTPEKPTPSKPSTPPAPRP